MIIQEEKVEIIDENSNPKKAKKIKKPVVKDKQKLNKTSNSNVLQSEPKAESEPEPEKKNNNHQELEKENFQLNANLQMNKNEETTSKPKQKKSNVKRFIKYFSIFLVFVFIIIVFMIGGFAFYNMKNKDKISRGISIYGIDVSNLTKNEAISKLSETFKKIEETEIKLQSEGYETTINPSEIQLKYNIDSAINYVFSIGKSGNLLNDNYKIFDTMVNGMDVNPSFTLNNDTLASMLEEMSKNIPNAVEESSYYVEDDELIITKGKAGYVINTEKTQAEIKNRIKDFSFLTTTIQLSLIERNPKEVDLDKIYEEVHKDPKDAYYTKSPFVVHPSETGIDFKISLDKAKEELAEADSEYTIALKTVYPKITTDDIGTEAFPDLLAEFSTHYVSNANRTTNLKLAANKINGKVLLPDETFSYNKVVGARTIAAGYKDAAIYQNGQVVDGLGGGICQISTTLFNAVLFANLKIVEIHNHQFVPSYVGAGRDATVVYGSKDFKFKNSRKYAIKIKCSVSGGIANFKIYGVKEDTEYKVNVNASVSSGGSNIKSTTYRTLSLNGKQVSKEKIYSCTYKKH